MGITEGQDILHLCNLQFASYYATIEFEMSAHVLDLPGRLRVGLGCLWLDLQNFVNRRSEVRSLSPAP